MVILCCIASMNSKASGEALKGNVGLDESMIENNLVLSVIKHRSD